MPATTAAAANALGGASGRVLAFVGSTGSIQALRAVLTGLDDGLQLPMIVLVHQSPDRPDDALVSALGRHSKLTIREARDGEALRPGHALVIPSGTHLLVHPGRHIELIPVGAYPPHRPSADLLLTTMATALGPDAIAVVLSGAGNDGATGATAIHSGGGTVITTDHATSRTFSMPKATITRDSINPQVIAEEDLAAMLIDRFAIRTSATT